MRHASRYVGCVALLGLGLTGALWAAVIDPMLYAIAGVVLGALIASLAIGELSAAALIAGALGALAHAALAPYDFALAGGAWLLVVYAPRALRARSYVGTAAHGILALVGGALGAGVAWAYAQATEPVQIAAVGVGMLLAAGALFWPIDDPTAFALRSTAGRAAGTLRVRLLRAVALRRRASEVNASLSRATIARVDRAWRALVRTARARVDGSPSVREILDHRIGAYVQALGRATRAATRAHDLAQDLDDVVLDELKLEGDELIARADALAEVQPPMN